MFSEFKLLLIIYERNFNLFLIRKLTSTL